MRDESYLIKTKACIRKLCSPLLAALQYPLIKIVKYFVNPAIRMRQLVDPVAF